MRKQKHTAMSRSNVLIDPSQIDLTESQEAACPAFRAFLLENRTSRTESGHLHRSGKFTNVSAVNCDIHRSEHLVNAAVEHI